MMGWAEKPTPLLLAHARGVGLRELPEFEQEELDAIAQRYHKHSFIAVGTRRNPSSPQADFDAFIIAIAQIDDF